MMKGMIKNMENSNKPASNVSNILFTLYIIGAIAVNILTNGDSPVISIFALIYGALILVLFKEDSMRDKIYFSTILFAILSFSFMFKVVGRYDIYFYYISTFIYLLFMLKDYRSYDFKKIVKNKYFVFLLIFCAYMIVSVAWSEDKFQSLKSIINYIIMFSLMIVVIDYNVRSDNIKKTIKYFLYMLPGIVLMGLVEITGYRFNIRNHYIDENLYWLAPDFLKKIPTTLFYSPNNYGVFIVLAMIFIAVAFLCCKKRLEKILLSVLFLCLQINLIFTTSRTAWISLFIVYVFAFIYYMVCRKRAKAYKILCIALSTLAVFFLVYQIPEARPYYGKFETTFAKGNGPKLGEAGSTNERYTLIVDIVDGVIFKGNVRGFGVGNTANYLKKMDNTNGITNPHSLWFEILGDFGVIIFILFCLTYLMIMLDLYKRYRGNNKLNYYIVSLIFSFFGFAFLSFAPSTVVSFTPYWILLGLGVSMIYCPWGENHEDFTASKLVSE